MSWASCSQGNCYNGTGTYTWDDGNKYIGEYKDGKKHGKGTLTWGDGNKYVGEWHNGKRNGQGTYTRMTGAIQVGVWANDEYFGTKLEWDKKEKAREEKEEREKLDRERKEDRKRRAREKAKKTYDKIYNACLIKKSLSINMQVISLRNAVRKTCENIATNPSWLDKWRYN